jgi:hypothetical protein
MFNRLKAWLIDRADRYQEADNERLHREGCRLQAEILKHTGGERIPLTPQQRQRLAEKARNIDSEVLKTISLFDLEDLQLPSPPDAYSSNLTDRQ